MAGFVLTAQLRLQAPTNLTQVANQIQSQLQNITATVNVVVPPQATAALNRANQNLNKTAKAAKQAESALENFGGLAALAAKRFIAFTIAGGAVVRLAGALIQATKDAIEFERQMNRVEQVTGASAKTIGQISKEISRLGVVFGASSTELARASLVLAQAGLTAEETRKSLQALAKSDLAPTFDNISNTTEGAIAIFRQFRLEADQLEGALGSINAVAGKFAVESSDIISAVRRTGGAFQAAGGNLNELIALFTSVRATTRESADSIATGFRTIFTRLQRVRTQNFLESLGIDLRDADDQFVGPFEAIRRLSTALKDLRGTDPRFAQVIEELGGFRQISKVIPLIQQFDTSQRALNVAISGSDSLSKDAATAQETLAVQIQQTREEFQAMIRSMTQTTAFKSLVGLALNFASALIKVADAIKPIVPLLALFGAAKLGFALGPIGKGFAGKLNSSGLNQGGVVGFNRGGLVPGVGNRDTVPAMLTPGEFVLRAPAVRALGLNKGGKVSIQKFAEGGKVLERGVGVIALRSLKEDLAQGGILETGVIKAGKENVKYTVGSFSVGFENQFEGRAGKTIVALTNNLGKQLTKDLGAKTGYKFANPKDVPNYRAIFGGLFEGAIQTMGAPFSVDQGAFDFPQGLKGATDKWAGGAALSNIPVDAKRTWTDDAKKSLKNKIINVINDPSLLDTEIQRKTRSLPVGTTVSAEQLEKDYPNLVPKTFTKSGAKAKRFLEKELGYGIEEVQGPNNRVLLRRKFATGGKVPAMLTPGEMVIPEPTAKKVGYNTLEKLNHYDKKQNEEGDLLKFAGGGFVPKPGRMLPKGGDIRRARRRRLDEEGNLTPQSKEYAKRRNKRFAELGKDDKNAVQRMVGYIDGDVLADPANAEVVKAQMKKYRKKSTKEYHDLLIKIARQRRKTGQLRKFKAVYGAPGAGKTSLAARPSPGDNASLRKTIRFPVLTPQDINRATEIIDTVASSAKLIQNVEKGGLYDNVDQLAILSTSTKTEQQELLRRRNLRQQQVAAGDPTAAQGRSVKAAGSIGAPIDTGAAEAVARAELGKRAAILGIQPDFKFRRKGPKEVPTLEDKKIGVFYGALAPATKGHAENARLAVEAGIDPKDLIVAISKIGGTAKKGDKHSQRTVIYNQEFRKALAQATFPKATVVGATAQDFAGTAQTVFERPTPQGAQRKFVRAAPGSVAFVGDDKGDAELAKYRKSGYDVQVGARTDISGTAAREAIEANDRAAMERMMTPGAIKVIDANRDRIQARTDVLPKLFERTEQRIGNQAEMINKELSQYPTQVTAQLKSEEPETAAKVMELRQKRDAIKRLKTKLPVRMLQELTRLFPDKYGFINEYNQGGKVNAMLTPGEAIIPAKAVKAIGARNLASFNRGGKLRKMANGGLFGGGGGLQGIATAGFALGGVSAAIQSLDGVPDAVKTFTSSLTAIGTQFFVLKGIIDSIGQNFNKLNIITARQNSIREKYANERKELINRRASLDSQREQAQKDIVTRGKKVQLFQQSKSRSPRVKARRAQAIAEYQEALSRT